MIHTAALFWYYEEKPPFFTENSLYKHQETGNYWAYHRKSYQKWPEFPQIW